MQKLKTKLKMGSKSCWWLWIPDVRDPDGKKKHRKKNSFQNPDFQITNDLTDKRGVLKLPKDRKEPHPGSITDKRLTVSDRKSNQVKSPVVYSAKGSVCMYVWTFPSSAASLHVDLPNPVVSRYAVFCCTSVSLDLFWVFLRFPRHRYYLVIIKITKSYTKWGL